MNELGRDEDRHPRRLTVLHVVPSSDRAFGGPVSTTASQIRSLRDCGVDSVVLSRQPGDGFENCGALDEVVARSALRFQSALRRLVHQSDIVHIHCIYRLHSLLAARECRRVDVPYVIEPHGSLTNYQWRIRRLRKWPFEMLIERRNLKAARSVVVASTMEATQLADRFTCRVVTVPHAVHAETHLVNDESEGADPGPAVLFLGRVTKKKRPELLVRSMASILAAHPAATLTIAGPRDKDAARRLSRAIKLASPDVKRRITILGAAYGADKARLLSEHKVFALPSEDENFGNAIVEALGAGLQIAVTDGCGALEYLEGSSTSALRIGRSDGSDFATCVSDLLSVPNEVSRAAVAAAAEQASQRLTDAAVSARLLQAYRS